ncbi:MAG: hypothetical protein C4320_09740, partial [Armatimonadota bacterium]
FEVTREIVGEAGRSVDEEGYEAALKEAQARSRRSHAMEAVYGEEAPPEFALPDAPATTAFSGYERTLD